MISDECIIFSTYMEGNKTGTVVKHKTGGYWGVHLIETPTSNSGFLMWHPTKSESWCESIAENFCLGMVEEDGSIPNG
jgi:hypothetical protein